MPPRGNVRGDALLLLRANIETEYVSVVRQTEIGRERQVRSLADAQGVLG